MFIQSFSESEQVNDTRNYLQTLSNTGFQSDRLDRSLYNYIMPIEKDIDRFTRFKAIISYNGSKYYGFESQIDLPTIQGELEKTLNKIVFYPNSERVIVHTAGRTDTGVHALGQVIHFDIPNSKLDKIIGHSGRTIEDSLFSKMNSLLPDDIRIQNIREVDENFHARFSAKKRTYLYNICDPAHPQNALNEQFSYYSKRVLDIESMNNVAKSFIGEHNFTSFIKFREDQSPVRTILEFEFKEVELSSSIVIQAKISGYSFGHNQVRSLMSAFTMFGSGQRDKKWILSTLEADRREGATGPIDAKGLILYKVDY